MIENNTLERYLRYLLHGDRTACRGVIEETMQRGVPTNAIYGDVIWPIMVEIDHLMRTDKISIVQEHLATRINRTIVDQLQNKLPKRPEKGKKIAVCCGRNELEELGAQMTADLFESDGWEVRFLGGGLTNDDILGYVNEYAPDILLLYGASPKQAPEIREMIDKVRSVNAWPNMRIMLSGGVFNRADGLWEEIGADLFAETAIKAVQVASKPQQYDPDRQMINRRRRRRRNDELAATLAAQQEAASPA